MPGTLFGFLPSFHGVRGPSLIDGSDLRRFFDMVLGAQNGVVAKAGGGVAAATPLRNGFNQIDTVATAADSVMLPPAIVGAWCWIYNDGAASMNVYNSQANPQNGGAADFIVAHGVTTPSAGNAAQAVGVGHTSLFVCMQLGMWKQVADFA
jgi:hypothetical protein